LVARLQTSCSAHCGQKGPVNAASERLTQSAAHDRAACAETLTDRVFRKFRARGERLLDDRVAERSIDRPCSISVGFCLRPGHGSEFPLREPF